MNKPAWRSQASTRAPTQDPFTARPPLQAAEAAELMAPKVGATDAASLHPPNPELLKDGGSWSQSREVHLCTLLPIQR